MVSLQYLKTEERQMRHFWKALAFLVPAVMGIGIALAMMLHPEVRPGGPNVFGIVLSLFVAGLFGRQVGWHLRRFNDLGFLAEEQRWAKPKKTSDGQTSDAGHEAEKRRMTA